MLSQTDSLIPLNLLRGEAAGKDKVSSHSIEHIDELQVVLIGQEVTEEKHSVEMLKITEGLPQQSPIVDHF